MVEQYSLFGYAVEIDKEKTQQWYMCAEEWGCECGDCLNFLELAKRQTLPPKILETLSVLGIPPEKATYVCHLTEENGEHLYQFSYRIVGNILKDDTASVAAEIRCCHETYPYGAPGFPEPHFDFECYAKLPWVID